MHISPDDCVDAHCVCTDGYDGQCSFCNYVVPISWICNNSHLKIRGFQFSFRTKIKYLCFLKTFQKTKLSENSKSDVCLWIFGSNFGPRSTPRKIVTTVESAKRTLTPATTVRRRRTPATSHCHFWTTVRSKEWIEVHKTHGKMAYILRKSK